MTSSIYIHWDEFDEKVLQCLMPILVLFRYEWSGPCSEVKKILHELAEPMEERLMFGWVDGDASPQLFERYDIRGVPTLILFQHGEVQAVKLGAGSKEWLVQWI